MERDNLDQKNARERAGSPMTQKHQPSTLRYITRPPVLVRFAATVYPTADYNTGIKYMLTHEEEIYQGSSPNLRMEGGTHHDKEPEKTDLQM